MKDVPDPGLSHAELERLLKQAHQARSEALATGVANAAAWLKATLKRAVAAAAPKFHFPAAPFKQLTPHP